MIRNRDRKEAAPASTMQRIVILGGGFGGLNAAVALRRADAEVTLIDRRNFHLFQPLLYQVATGGLSPGDITAPLRGILRKQKNTKVLLGDAVDLDAVNRKVILKDGGTIPYDSLIVATGARNFYFGHDAWAADAPGLKSIEDATEMRHKILYAFEAAERESNPDKRRAWLTFVVVGGGPTGVELAGALAEIANDTLRHDFRDIDPTDARILLLDGGARLLAAFPEELSLKAEKALLKLGVRTRVHVSVTGIDAHGVDIQTANGPDRIDSGTVLWAAGVAASPWGKVLSERAGATLDRQGRVLVEPDLSIKGHPEILVVGDLSHLDGADGKPLPGVAPTAMQQGAYAARILTGAKREPFHYFDKGTLAVIGRAAGVAWFGKLRFSGFLAWLAWLFIHLMFLVGFENRVLVFLQWGFQYFTFHRGARLITGPGEGGLDKT